MKLRLLICRDCRTVDELPAFDGPPEHDVLLEDLAGRHEFPNGERHVGNLAEVEESEWRDDHYRQKILEQIAAKTTGLESEFYATKNTYQEDALKCYVKHGRPDEGCIDWEDSKKRIGNPTKWGRLAGPKVYLCHFCPVKSWVKTQERWQAGQYK